MTNPSPPFSAGEYTRRLELTRAAMEVAGLDALFLEDPSNMAWLTGYDGWSFYVHQGVLVLPDSPPIWWGRGMDAAGARRTVWMADDRVHAYADGFVQAVDRHPMQDLAGRLTDLGLASGRIGVEMENYYFTAAAFLAMKAALPAADLVDATGLVNRCRTVKSAEEIAFMRRAARIVERAWAGILDRVAPGVRKNDVIAGIFADLIEGAGDDWGDYPAIVPMAPSGADASAAHLTWDGRPFRTGEATFFEIAGCYRRYHAPLCRTIFLGTPPADMRQAEAALVEGLGAGLDAARAGNVAGDVARALAAPLERAGIARAARCGYAVGLSYPPDWGERTISFRESDETVLEPGMTFHFMPGLWMEDWGLEITETILVREDRPAECLCNMPRQLFVKG